MAQQCVDRALALGVVSEEHGSRAWTLRLAAEVALARGLDGADRAAASYQQALALSEEPGMRPSRPTVASVSARCFVSLTASGTLAWS
jgi:hypothetical protein